MTEGREAEFLDWVRPPVVAVIGAADATPEEAAAALRIGRELAAAGATVLTGGRTGVMEAACRGAREAGGTTVGILPGGDAGESPPNRYVQIPVFTGLGDARNAVIVRTAGSVVAVGGGFGTLSEIGLALKAGRPVVLLRSWALTPPREIPGASALLRSTEEPGEAARMALALAAAYGPTTRTIPPPPEPHAANAPDPSAGLENRG